MIEVTDAMVQAFSLAYFHDAIGSDVRAGLAAALDVVERDYYLTRRPKPRWERPEGCMCSHLKPGRYKLCPVHGEG